MRSFSLLRLALRRAGRLLFNGAGAPVPPGSCRRRRGLLGARVLRLRRALFPGVRGRGGSFLLAAGHGPVRRGGIDSIASCNPWSAIRERHPAIPPHTARAPTRIRPTRPAGPRSIRISTSPPTTRRSGAGSSTGRSVTPTTPTTRARGWFSWQIVVPLWAVLLAAAPLPAAWAWRRRRRAAKPGGVVPRLRV